MVLQTNGHDALQVRPVINTLAYHLQYQSSYEHIHMKGVALAIYMTSQRQQATEQLIIKRKIKDDI